VQIIDGFRGPQGLTLADANTLYVADTVANTISRVALPSGSVTRVAGTGARTYLYDDDYADALETGLNSPWDVQWHDGVLYVAMAGQHQLWTLDTRTGRLTAFAGTRREALRDGPRLAAAFNQPSGLATDGRVLFVADSEASAVRAIDLESGAVTTPVGTGLFDFGDADGTGDAVRLQHPLGVEIHDGQVYVADTYNGKIKRLDPVTRRVVTLTGGLDEPGGLSVAGGRLYIADTNHHEVKVLDLSDGTMTSMTIRWPD
jgi:DNA-binding beta-propeller fold protein YncE